MQLSRARRESRRFYDGGTPPRDGDPAEPPAPDSQPRILLERHLDGAGVESWSLRRRIGYLDRHLGELLVPADDAFRSDLTSTPMLFTWLVPRTGAHLPAALLHDGLVAGRDADDDVEVSYVSTEGHEVDRVQADRIFRDAMADTGTGLVRRWIVWSAVTLASFFVATRTPWTTSQRWRHRAAAVLSILVVVWLGWSASADLLDVDWPVAVPVPWMPEGSFVAELAGGLVGALVVPALLSATWGRTWPAGMIVLVLLAVLLHVTVALALITLAYQLLERLVSLVSGRADSAPAG